MTKDMVVFDDGSWQFPYLLTVPFNSLLSALILYSMYGYVILYCFLAMGLLLILQLVANNHLAKLLSKNFEFTDHRI